MPTIDRINREYCRGTLRLGSEGVRKDWAIRQEKRSPCWTCGFRRS
ncbi:DUF4113 domain-containing protein [Vogesella margarita]